MRSSAFMRFATLGLAAWLEAVDERLRCATAAAAWQGRLLQREILRRAVIEAVLPV